MNKHYVYFRCWPGFAPAFPSDRFNHLADDEIEPALLKRVREMREHDESVARAFKRHKSRMIFPPMRRDRMTGEPLPLRPKAERRQATPQEEILLIAKAAGWTKKFFARVEGLEDCLWSERRYVHYTANSQSAKNLVRQLERNFSNDELVPRFGFVAANEFEYALQGRIEALVDNLRTESASFWREGDPLLAFARAVAAVADKLRPLGAEGEQPVGKGMSWQKAKDEAEKHMKRNNNVFPGVNALTRIIQCSPSTMLKAIKKSEYLLARKAEHESGEKKLKKVSLSDFALQTTPAPPHRGSCRSSLPRQAVAGQSGPAIRDWRP